MQTGGLDPLYRALLARNPAPIYRVEVWNSGARVDNYGDDGIPILDGSIQATLSSRVTRRLSMSVDRSLVPADITDLMTPYGNELVIRAGLSGYGGPDYMWAVFRGRIADVVVDNTRVQVLADDLAGELANSFYDIPQSSNTGHTMVSEWQRIVREAYPEATFGTSDVIAERMPKMTFSDSRAAAADAIAEAASAYWYTLGDGSFVMRAVPWATTQTPLLTLESGVDGSLIEGSYTLSRENVFNRITVVGEAADGSTPAFATVFDNNVASPTYFYGPFGPKGRRVVSNVTSNNGAAFQLAERLLRRYRALTRTWQINVVSDPALELGDCVTINHLDQMDIQVVESFNLPLTGDNVMNVGLRALVPGTEEEE